MNITGLREIIEVRHIDLSGIGGRFEEGPIGAEAVAGALHVSCQAEVVEGSISTGEVTLCGGVGGSSGGGGVAGDERVALMGHSALDLGRSGFGTVAAPVLDSGTLRFSGLIVDGDGLIDGKVTTAASGCRLRVVFRIVGLPGFDARTSRAAPLSAHGVPFVHRVFEGPLTSAGQSFKAVDGGPEWIEVGPQLRRCAMHAFDLTGPAGGTAWSSGRMNLRGQNNHLSSWSPVDSSSSLLQSAPHIRGIDLTPFARVRPNCSAAQAGVELRVHVFCCGGFGYVSPPGYRSYHSYPSATNLAPRTLAAVGEYATGTIQSLEVE